MKRTKVVPNLSLIILFIVAVSFYLVFSRLEKPSGVAYSDFRQAVAQGRVQSVVITPRLIQARVVPEKGGAAQTLSIVRVEDPELLKELQLQGIRVEGQLPTSFWETALLWLLPLGIWMLLSLLQRDGDGGRGSLLAVGKSKAKVYAEKDIAVRFGDVAGVDEAKEELKEVIEFLQTPDKFRRLGGKIPKGILLVGPPGTGKTLLARAVAGEAKVPFFSISGSEFVEMFVGVGAARVRDLFNQARSKAPCIIFIDELDALGKVRGVGPVPHEEREQTLNQLLVELDGFDPRSGVILMAATNRPEILDPALLRAGRFDRHVLVDRPDKPGRLAILKVHARNVALQSEGDLEPIAAMTAGMVGADMANIVNEAALLAARQGKSQVERVDLEEAVERVVAGLEKRNRILTRAERERVAHHEVGHALAAMSIPGSDAVKKISIIPRGVSAVGYTIQVPTEDRFLMTRTELENKIAVLLGGRAAEQLVYQELSTGAQDDLRKATAIARSMVRAYGMGESIGPVSLEPERRPLFIDSGDGDRGTYSERIACSIDDEIRAIIEAQEARVTALLAAKGKALDLGAQRLLAEETLTGEELGAIVHGVANPSAANLHQEMDNAPAPGNREPDPSMGIARPVMMGEA
jgi:cell division protease FtsH